MSWNRLTWVLICLVAWSSACEQAAYAQRQRRNAGPEKVPSNSKLKPEADPGPNGGPEVLDPLFPRPDNPASPLENIVRQAQSAYQQQQYEQAIDLTSQVLNSNPRHAVARYYRASALIDLGRREASAQKVRAGIADAREALGIAGKQHLIFHIPYFYGLTSLAELENKPAHAQLAVSIATPLATKEDLPANVRPLVYYQRALAKMLLKDYLGAAADYGEAVKLDPQFQTAHFGRADAFLKAGDPGKARASFDQAVAELSDDALVFNNRGTFNVQQGRIDAAIADFTRALELNPNFYMAALNRGFARTQKLEWFEAENDYVLSLEAYPQNPLAQRLLGTARVAQGKLGPAGEAFTQAIALAPNDADNYAGRGFARYFAKDYAGATADFTKARQLQPTAALYALWKYAAQSKTNQAAAAKTELETFLQSLPATPNWHATLSQYMLGKIDDVELIKAANASMDVTAKAQWLCEAHYFQGLKSEATQKPEEARKFFEESLKTNQAQLTAFIGAKLALVAK